jgi:outer membrane protein OmpA-like peptidoglycan-associated protein
MRWFPAIGGVPLLAVMLAGMVLPGCWCVSPELPRDATVLDQPPEAMKPFTYAELPPSRPSTPYTPPPPSERIPPAQPPSTAMAPAVIAAIEDLGQKYPGLFTFDKEKGLFRFNSDITFDSGSSVVKPDAKAALTKLAQILSGEQAGDRMMTIIGHTDSDRVRKAETIARLKKLGKPADNMGLSEARAEAVAEILRTGGVDAGRLATQGKGETNPIADNTSPAGKAKNRRVDIYLTPMAGAAPAGRTASPPGK